MIFYYFALQYRYSSQPRHNDGRSVKLKFITMHRLRKKAARVFVFYSVYVRSKLNRHSFNSRILAQDTDFDQPLFA